MPIRIQMTRQKPWRHEHPNAVMVTRPGKWGNPISLESYPFAGFLALSVVGMRGDRSQKECRRAAVVELFKLWIELPEQMELREAVVAELRGKDLACWCPLDQPCHADVLLKIANQ
jgi:hypothetical protein